MIIKRLPKDQQRMDSAIKIGNIAVKRAQQENLRAGIINFYAGDDGSIYYGLPRPNPRPDGELK